MFNDNPTQPFGCIAYLEQSTCGEAYSVDKKANGFKRFGGCPSCVNRIQPPQGLNEINAHFAYLGR